MTGNAPFFARVFAFLLDLTALFCILGIIFLAVAAGSSVSDELTAGQMVLLGLILFLSVVVVPPFYFTFLTCGDGQTLGKWFMDIRTVDRDGRPIGALRAFCRCVCYGLSALPFLAGFLLAIVVPGRSLHDLLAGTRVMEEE